MPMTSRARPLLRVLGVCLLLSVVPLAAQGAFTSGRVVKTESFLSFDRVHPGSAFRIAVVARVDEGWHINADRPSLEYLIATKLELSAPEGGIETDVAIYPPHVEKAFSFTDGKTLRVFEGKVPIGIEARAAAGLPPGPRILKGTLTVQACNDASCLAPAKIPIEIPVPIAAPGEPIQATHADIFGAIRFPGGPFPAQAAPGAGAAAAVPPPADNTVGRWVSEWGWGMTLAWIFLGGLALNLTPCVYPLIPITLAYFGGQSAGRSGMFSLATIYVLGMCATYSALGVVAATTGSVLGSALQSPLVVIFVAAVMVALGLSMLGLYEIQVPSALRRRITSRPGYGGALFMGLTVGLVAAPCVGPFVVSLLAFVGQIGSPVLGFWLFFVLALGLGLPYLLLGGFAGRMTGRLPRAGAWMEWVKKVFACILFAMGAYVLNPLLPGPVSAWTIPIVLLASAAYLGFIEGSPIRSSGFRVARVATAAACVAVAAALLLPSSAMSSRIAWTPYSEEALRRAAEAGQPVIIDFTADWCLPCKELEHFTFSDPRVADAARGFAMLRADITSQVSEEVAQLQSRHAILGAPTIVFLDGGGREIHDLRLTGFEGADRFLERMERVR